MLGPHAGQRITAEASGNAGDALVIEEAFVGIDAKSRWRRLSWMPRSSCSACGRTRPSRGERRRRQSRRCGTRGSGALLVKLLWPLARALDGGQANGRGLGSERRSFYKVEKHFASFIYDIQGRSADSCDQLRLEQHTLRCLQERKRYTLRPIHSLAYLLDLGYIKAAEKPAAAEATEAFALLKKLTEAQDVKVALGLHGVTDESGPPASYSKTTHEHIMH